MPDHQNKSERSADAARRIIDAVSDRNYAADIEEDERPREMGTDICDVIADLHHLADRYGLDFPEILDRAERSYNGDNWADGDGNPAERKTLDTKPACPRLDKLIALADDVAQGNSEYDDLSNIATALLSGRELVDPETLQGGQRVMHGGLRGYVDDPHAAFGRARIRLTPDPDDASKDYTVLVPLTTLTESEED